MLTGFRRKVRNGINPLNKKTVVVEFVENNQLKQTSISPEEYELQSYLQYLNSAMSPFEMRKLIQLISNLKDVSDETIK